MIWTCDFTSEGHVISSRKPCGLPAGALVSFSAGLDPGSLTVQFTSPYSSGETAIDLPGGDMFAANASGRMNITLDGETVETGQVLPLLPGIGIRDVRVLRKLADDHRRRALLLGAEARLYRRNASGEACPDCTDPATGARLRHGCAVCGGSGKLVGWAGPYSVSLLWARSWAADVAGSAAGTLHESATWEVSISAFPRPKAEDRMLLPGGRVAIVGMPMGTVSGVAGIPAVVRCPVRVLDPDTAAANVPAAWLE